MLLGTFCKELSIGQSLFEGKFAGALQIFSYQSASSVKHAVALQIFSYQSASSVKYAVALQYLLSPIRFKAETCRGPTRTNLCVSANQTNGENMPGPYRAGSPTQLLYEKQFARMYKS